LKSISEERQFRLEALDQNGAGARNRFLHTLRAVHPAGEFELVRKAFDYACQVDYHHVGGGSESYLAHPLRVAEMVENYGEPRSQTDVAIALLHNILEVSNTSLAELENMFGPTITDSIVNLTVDRKKQWDPVYQCTYYKSIRHGYKGACVVKVFDKLDNIFTLCLNADERIRTAYVDEIEEYVIPLAREVVPAVAGYFAEAAEEARAFGYLAR
jgi:GTP pyrophosphokinase